jgi:hypothetical protein
MIYIREENNKTDTGKKIKLTGYRYLCASLALAM